MIISSIPIQPKTVRTIQHCCYECGSMSGRDNRDARAALKLVSHILSSKRSVKSTPLLGFFFKSPLHVWLLPTRFLRHGGARTERIACTAACLFWTSQSVVRKPYRNCWRHLLRLLFCPTFKLGKVSWVYTKRGACSNCIIRSNQGCYGSLRLMQCQN
jgi:hypothetical protein